MGETMRTIEEMKAARQKAADCVSELCQGHKRWVMSVPARENEDADLIISRALRDEALLLQALADQAREHGEREARLVAALKVLAMDAPCQHPSLDHRQGFARAVAEFRSVAEAALAENEAAKLRAEAMDG